MDLCNVDPAAQGTKFYHSFEEVRLVILRENIRFSVCELPHDRLASLLRSRCEFNGELVRTSCETFSIPCGHAGIRLNCLSGLWIRRFLDVERPQHLRNGVKQVPICQVNARAQSSAIAFIALVRSGIKDGWERTIAIMVSVIVISRVGVLRSQQQAVFIMIRIKGIGIGEFCFVVMKAPDVDEDDRALRQQLTIDNLVWMSCYSQYNPRDQTSAGHEIPSERACGTERGATGLHLCDSLTIVAVYGSFS